MAINRVYLNHVFILPLHTDHNHYTVNATSGKVITAPAGAEAARCAIWPKSVSFAVFEGSNPDLEWPTGDGNMLCGDPVMMDLDGASRTITLSGSDDGIVFIDWFRFNPIPYPLGAVTFDGTTTYITHTGDLTNAVNSNKMTIAFWVKPGESSDDSVMHVLTTNNAAIDIYRSGTNEIVWKLTDIHGHTMTGTSGAVLDEVSPYTLVMMSFDISDYNAPRVIITYNDTVQESEILTNNFDTSQIRLTGYSEWVVGASKDHNAIWDGEIAMVLVKFGVALDFEIEVVRRKFITSSWLPVNLGPTGALPFSDLSLASPAPEVYLTILADQTDPEDIAVNRGTGGNFDSHGDLVIAATSPSNP